MGAEILPTTIERVDSQLIVATTYVEGGMYHGAIQSFFRIDAKGISSMNPEVMSAAADEALPAGHDFWGTPAIGLAGREWTRGFGPSGEMSKTFCCPYFMIVKFRVNNGISWPWRR